MYLYIPTFFLRFVILMFLCGGFRVLWQFLNSISRQKAISVGRRSKLRGCNRGSGRVKPSFGIGGKIIVCVGKLAKSNKCALFDIF